MARPSSQASVDGSGAQRFAGNLPDESSQARTERILRESREALRLAQTLTHINNLRRGLSRRSHYDPNQPRVPAGNRDGGQWTRVGDDAPSDEPEVVSDATTDHECKVGARYATNRSGRGPVRVRIGQRWVDIEFGQAARLAEAQARVHDAVARVRELDPNWSPKPSAYESVEGLIATYHAEAREAEGRIAELARVGIGPGPFAGESIPARGPDRRFNVGEQREGNRIFFKTGCHTCGTFSPGTGSGNCVLDHQMPNALNSPGRPQRLYPQCLACSRVQGGWVGPRGIRR